MSQITDQIYLWYSTFVEFIVSLIRPAAIKSPPSPSPPPSPPQLEKPDEFSIIVQCLTNIPSDIDANRELLKYGQSLSEKMLDQQQTTFSSDDQLVWRVLDEIDFSKIDEKMKTLLVFRYSFIKYLLRLECYEEIFSSSRHSVCINENHWKNFRSASWLEILIDMAHKSEWRAIKVILSRHESDTREHWLSILSNFPETLEPSLYQDLLPSCDPESGAVLYIQGLKQESFALDEMDWFLKLGNKLSLEDGQFVENFYLSNPFFSDFRRQTLDVAAVSSWYLIRAREIENRSSLVSNAIELLEIGINRKIPDLELFVDDLDAYATLVYQCFPMYNIDDIGFSEFERLSQDERVNLFMLGAAGNQNNFLDCLKRFLLPYLHKVSKNDSEEKAILWDFIFNLAKHKLNIVQKIFIDYKMCKELGSIDSQQIIKSDDDLIDYGIRCIYANERTDQLDSALNIVETFPEDKSQFFQFDTERKAQVHKLYKRLEVTEVLEQYNHFIAVARLEEMVKFKDKQGVLAIFNKITREFCRNVDSATLKDQDWSQLLKDMEGMRVACFQEFIPQQEVSEVFIKGIITSGRLEQFKLASNFMQLDPKITQKKLMSYEKSVETILEAAQHYVNSAASVTDEIINTAKKCLGLLGDETVSTHPGIQKEMDFIEALSILGDEFDVKILPIQIRLMEDSKIELIHQIISSQPKAYKKTNELLKLSQILNIFGPITEEEPESNNEVRLLTILGNIAYERDDFNHCWTLCKLIMDKGYTSGWRLCELLGNCSSFKKYDSRLKLLSFVVTYCDPSLIAETLTSVGKLKLLILEESLDCLNLMSESTFSSLTSTSSALLSSIPTVEMTSKLIKSVTRLAADQKDDQSDLYENESSPTIKKTPSTITTCYNSFNISPFYYDAFHRDNHFQFNCNNYDYNYLEFGTNSSQINLELTNYQIRLRIEMLKEQNCETITTLCKQLSELLLPVDTFLCLSTILPLKGANDELPFNSINPKSSALIFTGLYFYSLLLYLKHLTSNRIGKNMDDNMDSTDVSSLPMSAIISKSDQICKEPFTLSPFYPASREKQLIESYFEMYCNIIQSDTIASLDPSVDVERFASDCDYRSDTLLGLAMTTDDKIFNVVISLGKQYSLPLIDLYLTHLEFLLTDPTNEIEMIANRIFKNDSFVSILVENKSSLEGYFEKRIFPLVHPDDHNRLVLCYQIIEKFCYSLQNSSSTPSPSSSIDDINHQTDQTINITTKSKIM